MRREQVEVDLQFLGLLIFENKLKPGTAPAIATLRSAHLGCRMVTGDNPRTAVSVARECKLINPTAFVFYPSFVEGDMNDPRSMLEWRGVDDESLRLDPYSLRPLPPPPHVVDEERIHRDYDLAITGDVFRWMIDYAPLETLQQVWATRSFSYFKVLTYYFNRCCTKRMSSLACPLTRSMNWWKGCSQSDILLGSVEMARMTVAHSRPRMSESPFPKPKQVSPHLLRAKPPTLGVS